ncbi:MAG: PilZ domain-containing protein [Methylobacter tundripaludum]|nr:PilZ domain-containing protein [Methylobacter tundripaludum]
MDKINVTKNKNRRVFFRIYDEVNLFYQKIDEKLLTEPQPVFDNISSTPSSPTGLEKVSQDSALLLPRLEKNLPDSQFKENETRNVNISASGMAFDCEDALKEGDYLVIKILLASGMTSIVTDGKVVYCKNIQSNDNECPYFVGAHFINMKDDDRELLIKHVDKKRLQRRWVNALILAVVITVIALPDVVFGLLSELCHFLFELFLEFSHLAFEFIESNLDHLVEHLFETDVHQTQVIVFYIIVLFVFYGFYRLWQVVPPFCRWCKKKQIAYWSRKKANLLFYWREQSSLNKLKLVVIGVAVITGYIFFGM